MMNNQQIFEYFDKEHKRYLKKHEFKLSLIYKFGYKMPYDEVKRLWKGRFSFEAARGDYDSLFDKNTVSNGVSFAYFQHIATSLSANVSEDRKTTVEFQALDAEDKGYFSIKDLGDLVARNGIKFISPYQLQDIFDELDCNGDGKVSLVDFRKFMAKASEN